MVEFRYLLVTLVAVFLALGIGILMGAAIGEELKDDVQNRIDSVSERNEDLHAQIDELTQTISADEEFASDVEQWFVEGALRDKEVVLFEFEGTDESTIDELIEEIEQAGGSVTVTVTFAEKLRLEDSTERDELALILASTFSSPEDLRAEAGTVIGSTAGIAAEAAGRDPQRGNAPAERLDDLFQRLERADFIGFDVDGDAPPVHVGASFVIVAGGDGNPPFPFEEVLVPLATELAKHDAGVLVAESRNSTWGAVGEVRESEETNATVASVDRADTIAGQIAVVLGLARAADGDPGHFGVDSGAESVIPLPSPPE